MFSTLVESRSAKGRRSGGVAFSFLAHYGLILAVIYTSAQAATVEGRPRQEKIAFIEPPEPAVNKEPPPPELVAAPPAPRIATVLVAPVEIPTVLPEIDLRRRPTDPSDFERRAPATTDTGAEVHGTTPSADNTYVISQVEKPVAQAPNSATPAYPDMLRQAGIEGEALVSFVVDTTGRADAASFKVIRTTHELFATAVKNALPRMRFIPAEIGDRKVKQFVQQPYSFAIVK
jgi:protein TonB